MHFLQHAPKAEQGKHCVFHAVHVAYNLNNLFDMPVLIKVKNDC